VLGYNECRPLQDYLTHRIVEFAGHLGLPVVFHTGIQAGNGNKPDNCRPERLWNLIARYRSSTFILLHAGIPWTDEAGMLAKYFPNVYLDMAWMHIISPEQAQSALRTWVDLVPRNRILGFGGDYGVVEKVYGHIRMAKQNIARALSAKIEQGDISEADARDWCKSMLSDNPRSVYALDEMGS
jgi:predicted TIM-barrel fold metal-dependent hydrolase